MSASSTSTTWSTIRVWASSTDEKSVGPSPGREEAVDDARAALRPGG